MFPFTLMITVFLWGGVVILIAAFWSLFACALVSQHSRAFVICYDFCILGALGIIWSLLLLWCLLSSSFSLNSLATLTLTNCPALPIWSLLFSGRSCFGSMKKFRYSQLTAYGDHFFPKRNSQSLMALKSATSVLGSTLLGPTGLKGHVVYTQNRNLTPWSFCCSTSALAFRCSWCVFCRAASLSVRSFLCFFSPAPIMSVQSACA